MIAIKKLSKYFGKRVIFDDLNLSFDKGKSFIQPMVEKETSSHKNYTEAFSETTL